MRLSDACELNSRNMARNIGALDMGDKIEKLQDLTTMPHDTAEMMARHYCLLDLSYMYGQDLIDKVNCEYVQQYLIENYKSDSYATWFDNYDTWLIRMDTGITMPGYAEYETTEVFGWLENELCALQNYPLLDEDSYCQQLFENTVDYIETEAGSYLNPLFGDETKLAAEIYSKIHELGYEMIQEGDNDHEYCPDGVIKRAAYCLGLVDPDDLEYECAVYAEDKRIHREDWNKTDFHRIYLRYAFSGELMAVVAGYYEWNEIRSVIRETCEAHKVDFLGSVDWSL